MLFSSLLHKNGFRFLIAFTGICLMLLTFSHISISAKETTKLEDLIAGYALRQNPDHSMEYINYMDGYALVLPFAGTVSLDHAKNISSLVSKSGNVQVDIMRQRFSANQADNSKIYRSYSHRFLKNKEDHQTISDEVIEYNGKSLHLTEWTRNRLAKIENDKNYYYYIDYTISNKDILTIHCKSDSPISKQTWLWMVDSIRLFVPSVSKVQTVAQAPTNRKWAKETEEFYQRYLGENAGLTWGIFSPQYPYYTPALRQIEHAISHTFPIVLDYHGITKVSKHAAQNAFANAKAENRVLEYTVQPPLDAEGTNYVYRLLSGEFDKEFTDIATGIVSQKHPVLFRLFNEMNGDWCSYSAFHTGADPEIFKEAYRYVYRIFEESGANQYAIWVWNPNERSFPNYLWNSEMAYYPGDAYVDVIGMTAYNTGNYYIGEYWKSFSELYDDLYDRYSRNFTHPLMITEFASNTVGGDKVFWTKDMLVKIEEKPRIKIAIWWNGADKDKDGNEARIYYIDRPRENLDIFRRYFLSKQEKANVSPHKSSAGESNK